MYDLAGLVFDGLNQLLWGVHTDVRADAQQARSVVVDLRAGDIHLDDAVLLGRDPAEEVRELEAFPPPLGDPGPHPEPLAERLPRSVHPVPDGEFLWWFEALDLLGCEEAIRPHPDIRPPFVVETGAVPVALSCVPSSAPGGRSPGRRAG